MEIEIREQTKYFSLKGKQFYKKQKTPKCLTYKHEIWQNFNDRFDLVVSR
jgi:hypothetical protein